MELIFVHGALVRDGQWWWQPAADLLLERTGIRSRSVGLPSCGEATPDQVAGGLVADAAALRAELDEVDGAIAVVLCTGTYCRRSVAAGPAGTARVRGQVQAERRMKARSSTSIPMERL